ncbi:MAG: uracil-DNA glycosylase [Bacteroidia bacterium]
MADVQLEESWKEVLLGEFEQAYFLKLKEFLKTEKAAGKMIFPPGNLIFNAFEKTPFDKVKVVIIGQDPYHGAGQAHGLSFSVPMGMPIPASLRNIYKELEADISGFVKPKHGNLEKWAEQGVLMLNATLTVEATKAGSHQKKGWEQFTDAVIKQINDEKEGVIFLLWGRYAQDKGKVIDTSRHHVLVAAHPSPLAGDAFLGNKHFSKTNELLQAQGQEPIDWHV